MKKFFSLSSVKLKDQTSNKDNFLRSSSKRFSIVSSNSLSSRHSLNIEVIREGYNVDLSRVDATFSKLHRACLMNYDQKKTLKYLKKYGHCVNQVDNVAQCSPLHLCVVNGNHQLLKLLLQNGGDVNLRDGSGKTLLIKSIECANELVQFLINNGANVNKSDSKYGNSPLHWAILSNYYKAVSTLLTCSEIDVNLVNLAGETPLHLIAKSSKNLYVFIADLQKYRLNLDAQDAKGRTALFCACANGNFSATELLIKAGANLHIANSLGEKPLDIAKSNTYLDIVQLIESNQGRWPDLSRSGSRNSWPDSPLDASDHSDSNILQLRKSAPSLNYKSVVDQLKNIQQTNEKNLQADVDQQNNQNLYQFEWESSEESETSFSRDNLARQQIKSFNQAKNAKLIGAQSKINQANQENQSELNQSNHASETNIQIDKQMEKDNFIKQMKSLLDEEIELNNELDEMLLKEEKNENKVDSLNENESNNLKENVKHETIYVYSSDEELLEHEPVKTNDKFVKDKQNSHIVYGLSDEEDSNEENLNEKQLNKSNLSEQNLNEQSLDEHNFVTKKLNEQNSNQENAKLLDQSFQENENLKNIDKLRNENIRSNVDNSGNVNNANEFKKNSSISNEINKKLEFLNQMELDNFSKYEIEVPENKNYLKNIDLNHGKELDQLKSKIVHLTLKDGEIAAEKELIKTQIYLKEKQINLLKLSVDEQFEQSAMLQNKYFLLEQKYDALVKENSQINEKVDSLKQILSEKEEKNVELVEKLKLITSKENELRKNSDRLQTQLDQHKAQVKNLLEQLKQSNMEYITLKEDSERFHSEMQLERDKFIEFMREEQKNTENQLKASLLAKQEICDRLTSELSYYKEQFSQSNSKSEINSNQIEITRKLQQENDQLKRNLRELQNKIDETSESKIKENSLELKQYYDQNNNLIKLIDKLNYLIEKIEQFKTLKSNDNNVYELNNSEFKFLENFIIENIQNIISTQVENKLDNIQLIIDQLKQEMIVYSNHLKSKYVNSNSTNVANQIETEIQIEDDVPMAESINETNLSTNMATKQASSTAMENKRENLIFLQTIDERFAQLKLYLQAEIKNQCEKMENWLKANQFEKSVQSASRCFSTIEERDVKSDKHKTHLKEMTDFISNQLKTDKNNSFSYNQSSPRSFFVKSLMEMQKRSSLDSISKHYSLDNSDDKFSNFYNIRRDLDKNISSLKSDLGLFNKTAII